MSNKTRLQKNNTNLQALIDKANALPDVGSGSGSESFETCNITITSDSNRMRDIAYEYYDGTKKQIKIEAANVNDYDSYFSTFYCENVICGSLLVVSDTLPIFSTPRVTGGSTLLYNYQQHFFFQTPTEANVNATIHLRED